MVRGVVFSVSILTIGGILQGFDCIFTDYLPHRKFPIIGPAAMWILRFATGGVLIGVYQFNTNDIGPFSLAITISPFTPRRREFLSM